jgi:hypothetical protein
MYVCVYVRCSVCMCVCMCGAYSNAHNCNTLLHTLMCARTESNAMRYAILIGAFVLCTCEQTVVLRRLSSANASICADTVIFPLVNATPVDSLLVNVTKEVDGLAAWLQIDCATQWRRMLCVTAFAPYAAYNASVCASVCEDMESACSSAFSAGVESDDKVRIAQRRALSPRTPRRYSLVWRGRMHPSAVKLAPMRPTTLLMTSPSALCRSASTQSDTYISTIQ